MLRILSSVFLCFLFASQALAGTTGSIRGVVNDKATNEPMAGVTVIAKSPALQGEQVALSDEQGLYVITDLPPGTYTITAVFADATSERRDIIVQVDKTVAVNLAIALTAGAGEVYTIEEKAPNVDIATSTVGRTLTKDYIAHVPLGRGQDFSNAISASPSASGDDFGMSIGGATSPENNYVIDGLNSTGMSFGTLNTSLVLDFVDEFEIKEGGYGPEFGRATGGFVNVVTKGGSNEFHGSVFAHYRPKFLVLPPKMVEPSGSIVRKNDLEYYLNAGFELGGPIVKDLLWFHVGYAPEITSRTQYRTFRWYTDVNGVQELTALGAPVYTDTGAFDGVDSALTQGYPQFTQVHQYTLKLTHLINNNNRHSINLRGSPSFFNGYGGGMNGDASQNHFQSNWDGNLWSAVYNYSGKYFGDKLKVEAYIGAHHEETHTTPLDAKGRDAAIVYTNREQLRDIVDLSQSPLPVACDEKNDIVDTNGVRISRCQSSNYSRYGFGGLDEQDQTRLSEKIALTNLFQFAGLHQFKYGIDFEQVLSKRVRSNTGQPGGELVFQAFGPDTANGYFVGQGFAIDKVLVPQLDAKTSTLNFGVFAGDSWSPIPNLVLNYGIRWEGQALFGVKDSTHRDVLEHKFSILDNFAPRAGLVWDFTNQGKGAIRFNYGRYYESIPMDMNERGFGGESLLVDYRERVGCRPSGFNSDGTPKNPSEAAFTNPLEVTNPYLQCRPKSRNYLGGKDALVQPGLKGQYSDELILSADYEPFSSWVFGITGVYRYLGKVIEDISTDGGSTYFIANPGEFDITYINSVREELARTTDPKQKERLNAILSTASNINTFPKATRNIYQIQFKVDKKMSNNFVMNASYVLSWTKGNYPGLFSENNGQLDPNGNSQFDLPQLIMNRDGYLPQDRRHLIKVGGYYRAALKEFGVDVPLSFNLGLSAFAESGTPYDVIGSDVLYGASEIFILPRGSGGRLPWLWQVDLNAGVAWDFTDNVQLEVFANLFNIFNRQEVAGIDSQYTFSNVRPIIGGAKEQLAHLRDVDGDPVVVRPNFGNATAYQAPFGAQLGARLKF